MKSWRTTVAAVLFALAAVFTAGGSLLDDNPDTSPNWTLVMAEVAGAWGFFHARDNAVTSEEAGAK